MLRLTRLSDYAILMMSYMAESSPLKAYSSMILSKQFKLPLPTVSKILKRLQRAGLLKAKRGAMGGYQLATSAEIITVKAIIEAIEGPIAITQCQNTLAFCHLQSYCLVNSKWQQLANLIQQILTCVTLAQLTNNTDKNPWL